MRTQIGIKQVLWLQGKYRGKYRDLVVTLACYGALEIVGVIIIIIIVPQAHPYFSSFWKFGVST